MKGPHAIAGPNLSCSAPGQRSRGRPITFAVAFAGLLAALGVAPAAELRVQPAGNDVLLSWPTGAVTYVLQRSDQVGPNAAWTNVTDASAVAGRERQLTQPLAGAARFYRLRAPSNSIPAFQSFVATTNISLTATSRVTFSFSDPDGDIAAIDVTSSNAFQNLSYSLPVEPVHLTGTDGRITLEIRGQNLPFGPTTMTWRLRDAAGGTGAVQVIVIQVAGSGVGGGPPTLSNLTLPDLPLGRPRFAFSKHRAFVAFDYEDPDGDIERVRVQVTGPDAIPRHAEFPARSLGVGGTSGRVTNHLLSFTADNELGGYFISVTAVDRAGHAGNTINGVISLADNGEFRGVSHAPEIAGMSPSEGAPGTEVVLFGYNFNNESVTNPAIRLGSVPVEILELFGDGARVRVPPGARTGRFTLRNAWGEATSPNAFSVPPSLSMEPAEAELAVGGRERFRASVAGLGYEGLIWKVNGLPGGDGMVGTISNGLYRAPANVPASGRVAVAACTMEQPSLCSTAWVSVLPPAMRPGITPILPATGGRVVSADGQSHVTIPPLALPSRTSITVETLHGQHAPAAASGHVLLGAARFGPDGTAFNTPVTIVLPLTRYLPPGTVLPVQRWNAATSQWVSDGIDGAVAPNGECITAQVSHFTIYAVQAPGDQGGPPLGNFNLEPPEGQEGMNVPVRLTGAQFRANLEVQVLRDGNFTDDIIPGTYYGLTNQAGLVLHVQTIPDLPESESRLYTIRLRDPITGQFAEGQFTVHGLNEFILSPGAQHTVVDQDNRRYSTVVIPPTASLVAPPDKSIAFEATGPVEIQGAVLASGENGTAAVQTRGGNGGVGPRFGGRGGQGRDDNGCFGFLIDFDFTSSDDCAEPVNYGMPGNLPIYDDHSPAGLGGEPGANFIFTDAISSLIRDSVGCVLGAGLVSAGACVSLVNDIASTFELVEDVVGFTQDAQFGHQGLHGAFGPDGWGNGGGGGGGGGRLTISPDLIFCGGGGGGGGAGGRPVTLITAGPLLLDGLIDASGGNGGDGALPTQQIHGFYAYAGSLIGFTGGGGGGGSGGAIRLATAAGLSRGPEGIVNSLGGTRGFGGIYLRDAVNGDTRIVFRRGPREASQNRRDIDHPMGAGATTPVFMPTNAAGLPETDFRVMLNNRLDVQFRAVAGRFSTQRALYVTNQAGAVTTYLPDRNTNTFTWTQTLLLSNGFNTLAVDQMHPLMTKRVLVLATHSDGDGLSDADEASLGTNPLADDTDGDGLNDGFEVTHGTNPLDADSDDDSVPDGVENDRGMNPHLADSDRDGLQDSLELFLATDPVQANAPPSGLAGRFFVRVQDTQGRHQLGLLDPDTGRVGLAGQLNHGDEFGFAFDPQQGLRVSRRDEIAFCTRPLQADTQGFIAATNLGAFGGGRHARSLASLNHSNGLFAVETAASAPFAASDRLLAVDPQSGASTPLGSAGAPLQSIAFDCTNTLFAVLQAPGSNRLVRLDRSSGTVAQDIGPIAATPVYGLAFGLDGELFGTTIVAANQSQILKINPATGAATVLTTLPFAAFDLGVAPCPVPCFGLITAANLFDAGESPYDLDLADLNHDGHLDIVTVNRFPRQGYVLLGDGHGSFGPRLAFPATTTQNSPAFVAAGRLDGDAHPDLLVGSIQNPDDPDLAAATQLVGLGDGHFTGPQLVDVGSGAEGWAGDFALGDVNHDGHLDAVVPLPHHNRLSILLNDGLGHLVPSGDVATEESLHPARVVLADLNHDGHLDAVSGNEADFNGERPQVSVYLGAGDGQFSNHTNYVVEPTVGFDLFWGGTLDLADLDGDGHLDLVTVVGKPDTTVPSSAYVLRGDGAGNFGPPARYALPFTAEGEPMALADFSGDGIPDLVVSRTSIDNLREGALAFLLGDGHGGFTPGPTYVLPDFAIGLKVGDLNHDGRPDLVATLFDENTPGRGSAVVLLNQPPCRGW